MAPRVWLFVLFLVCCAFGRPGLDAQVRPIYDAGAAGLTHLLERLQTTASALHVGAHPDDEDSAFIARVARGDHARVAYLSLNRGEGGQNIIGPELFDALGVIRTEELLQARRLDGGEQFFTRTFDFGFSKSRDEAAQKWNERDVLEDMVRVIRSFRPIVIYSRFSGTPADGHGQHQLAGYLTPLAFGAAGDPSQFPEQLAEGLRPWQARKLYRGVGFRPDPANPTTIDVQTGIVHPLLGRSFAEIAAEGRSQHKSQQMGSIEPLGPATSGLVLLESRVAPAASERSIFDGIDTSLPGLAALTGLPAGSLQPELAAMHAAARRALDEYDARFPARSVPALAEGLRATRDARKALASLPAGGPRIDADALLAVKENDFSEALARAAGVVVDPLASDATVVPGGTVEVAVRTFATDPSAIRVVESVVRAPERWSVGPIAEARRDDGRVRREVPTHQSSYRVAVPADAPLSQPYFLRTPREGDSYRWPQSSWRGLPFDPPQLTAVVTFETAGVPVTLTREVQYRVGDEVRGELRRSVDVVPAIAVGVDTNLLVVPLTSAAAGHRVVLQATSFSPTPVTGTLRLRMPAGWTSTPAESTFVLNGRGERTSAAFVVSAPARRTAGTFAITAEASAGGSTFSQSVQEISYPHIQTHRLYSPAAITARVFDLQVAPVRVGYVMGSGDLVPEALRRIGVDVTLIDDEMLGTGDLSRFDTIVVGIRASEARPQFVASGRRLLEYTERGGTLVVQYQQGDYTARGLPPFPAAMPVNSRVTVETAPVRILAPAHPAMTFPNTIGQADFDGWVQERNLYAFVDFDPRYVPLLESADPGEPPQRGAEVYAAVGKGRYVYTAYSWFRQLPAGVPGAYRQFANLISLSKAPR
jgi:LmbE family N-acetylglucosaminyl deacetylase